MRLSLRSALAAPIPCSAATLGLQVALCLIVGSPFATAQSVDSTLQFCRSAQATYARCALRVKGGWVLRGEPGQTVGIPGVLFRVTRQVVGDSAMKYARLAETNEQRAGIVHAVGLLVIMPAALIFAHPCHENASTGVCHRNKFPSRLEIILGSIVVPRVVTAVFEGKANHALSSAISLNNERLAR